MNIEQRLKKLEETVGIKENYSSKVFSKSKINEREEPWIIFELEGSGNSRLTQKEIQNTLKKKLYVTLNGDLMVNIKDLPIATKIAEDNGFEISVLERAKSLKSVLNPEDEEDSPEDEVFWLEDPEERKDVLTEFKRKIYIDYSTSKGTPVKEKAISCSLGILNQVKRYCKQQGYTLIVYKNGWNDPHIEKF